MNVGDVGYVTYNKDKDGTLVIDVVILLEQYDPNGKRLVMGHKEYRTESQCLWDKLDYALDEYPTSQWYRFCVDSPDTKRANHKWWHYNHVQHK